MKKLLFILMLFSSATFAQITATHFNAGWNNANSVSWFMGLKECNTKGLTDIGKDPEAAKKYKIATSTFANAFVNDRPFVTSNIIGATTIDQLKENIDSIDITLSQETLEEIENIHLSDPNPCV